MAIAVHRANVLLSKVRQLRARESTFEDAMRLAHKYTNDVGYGDEPCSSTNCIFTISLGYGWTEPPPFIYDMNVVRAVGVRASRFAASVRVRDGRVIGTGFVVWTEAKRNAPFGQWLVVVTELRDHLLGLERGFYYGRQLGLEEHPHHYVVKPHLTAPGWGEILVDTVTPDASSTDIERAFDFHLLCISSLAGCSGLGDLLPTAWQDYVALEMSSRQTEGDREYGACPLRSLARLARDIDNVLLVEVKRIFPVDGDQTGRRTWNFN